MAKGGKVTSVRLSDELMTQLDRLAELEERPRSWLIEQAIARFVYEELWHVESEKEAYDESIRDPEGGTPHDEVMKELDEMIQARVGDASRLA